MTAATLVAKLVKVMGPLRRHIICATPLNCTRNNKILKRVMVHPLNFLNYKLLNKLEYMVHM